MKIYLAAIVAVFALHVSAAPKYVFLMIGDGMAMPQRMVAEEFSKKTGGGPLVMNAMPYKASTHTKSASSVVTDSAAAATAIACGVKTCNGRVGLDPEGKRLESVAEIARKRGMKVGIITTVTIHHATPAGFYAHRMSRGDTYGIGLDLVDSGFDHFAGGGMSRRENHVRHPQYRGNIFTLATNAGYTVTKTTEAWKALKPGGKTWSVFSRGAMPFEIDHSGSVPHLHEMLEKAIELLDGDAGFFIMCEGGKIDYSGHSNDAATNVRDVLEFDRAVKVALDFMKNRPEETLVIVTGDHETGGMSMGFSGIGGAFKVELLAGQKISVEKYSSSIKRRISKSEGNLAYEDVEKELVGLFGLEDMTAQERAQLKAAFEKDVSFVKAKLEDTTAHDVRRRYVFAQTVKNVLNSRAGIGWSTSGHSAAPTLTTAAGKDADILVGMTDNTDIGRRLIKLIRGDGK